MPNRRIPLAAATAVLAVAAALGVLVVPGHLPGHHASRLRLVLDDRRAQALTDGYRRDAVAQLPAGIRYAGVVSGYTACPGGYHLSTYYNLTPQSGAVLSFTGLRRYWTGRGYRVVNDTPGLNPQLLVEDPADGYRIGISQRTTRFLRLAITSSCFAPAAPPVPPALPQDIATAQGAYERYVAGQLDRLVGDVGALRGAIAGGDLARARTAWLTALLCWDRVGAAYGSFGDFADAIDGLPGAADFRGLHRIEYGLWHGDSTATLLGFVDKLAGDVKGLRAALHENIPNQVDLPLRTHEVLEDDLRDQLTGLTDLGGGAGLAETLAGVDATAALLDAFAPTLDARRPALLPAARAGLDALRRALLATRAPDGSWRSPTAADPTALRRAEAALGSVLETLAQVPGLLEVTGS